MVQGLQIEDSELREYTHGMLGSIADKLGKDFAPFLSHAVEGSIRLLLSGKHSLPHLADVPRSQSLFPKASQSLYLYCPLQHQTAGSLLRKETCVKLDSSQH